MASISRSERELWTVLRAEDPHRRAEASFSLASLLAHRGQLESAEELLFGLTEEGTDALRAEAWIRLAEVLSEQGKCRFRDLAFRRAGEFASVSETPGILIDLAAHLEADGGEAEALRIFERVARGAGDQSLAATAAFRFGRLVRRLGHPSHALEAFREALAVAGPAQFPHIALALAEVLIETGSQAPADRAPRDEAEHLLQRVIDFDHPDLSPQAAMALAELRRSQEQSAEAYRLCRLVIDSRHPDYREAAHAMQSRLLHGELARAARVPGPAAAFNLMVHARGARPRSSHGPRVDPTPVPCPAGGWRPMDRPVALGPAPSVPKPACPARGEGLLIVVTHGTWRLRVEFDLETSSRPLRSPITALIASVRRHLGAWHSPTITELSYLRRPLALEGGAELIPALALPRPAAESARVCERLLGEVLAAAIAEELVDLGTLRALVAQLPASERYLRCDRRSLGPLTKTISELMLERHLGVDRGEDGETEEITVRLPEASRHVLVLDQVERLCCGSHFSWSPSSAPPPGRGVAASAVPLPSEVTGHLGDPDLCDRDDDYYGLYR
jgi:tetratricopeptide (TPR) repeat protein